MPSQFLELTVAAEKPKTLYIPTASIISYEEVPEGKNDSFPDGKTFVRYDYGQGLSYAMLVDTMDKLREEIGQEGYLNLRLMDGAELNLRGDMIIAMEEKEDEGVDLTQLSLALGNQMGALFVADKVKDIIAQRGS
jgi:hypothetical protein